MQLLKTLKILKSDIITTALELIFWRKKLAPVWGQLY